ncbi:DUF3604 domain-containing protein [Pseudenhygromyxa sp. WMMC2535]|uniref:DUF3604 domain-containing protein n=1 Tax=Pseudenhygromyxa sp. WMMC2535 TaxID=2712867 RepID=UPI0015557DD5|nr:DUF3604 domain-containing protein [Pseudenhygromyxa sp. WMMC2535]NVB37646.1 DUF3604 domain-containing protein [Pseudenhygromyxa sp. WMMC2535]
MDHREPRLGRVVLSPAAPVVAGSVGEWRLTYTVGSYGIDEGGTIKVARRFASDWGRPQFEDPRALGYTTVTTTGAAKLRPRYDPKAHVRPWMKCVVIDVYDGCLAPGDEVVITFGDRRAGSPGIQAQSFIESAHEIRVLVDPTNACLVERLPSSPVVPVISGEPEALVVLVPTQVAVGEAAEIFVKGEDRWGNPTPPPEGVALCWRGEGQGEGQQAQAEIEGEVTPGARRPEQRTSLRPSTAGSGRVIASWGGREYASNPITTHAQPPALGKYWAELHAQSDATVGTGSEREYFEFGRDWARVDVMSHQGNDFQMDEGDWARLEGCVHAFHRDGDFVVFPGYEWSANTAAGGDRNVIYREEGRPIMRSSHWQIDTPEDARSPAHPASDLFAKLREHVGVGEVLVMAHCGGRYADIRRYFDEALGPLVEVASCWGIFEWLLWDAFEMGYRVGVVCNSDGHKGRPGAEGPGAGQFGIFGGLTCVLAESLTRAAVFEALLQRRCYGTTGPRMDLDFEVGGEIMGGALRVAPGPLRVRASVRGEAAIEALELYRGRERVFVARPPGFEAALADSRRLRLRWGGARIRGRGRRAVWDGRVEVEGARIEAVETFAFDSPLDGVLARSDTHVELRSRTTGDLDGIDLWLDQARAGKLRFSTELGELEVDLAELGADGHQVDFGGLDLHARVERMPERLVDTQLSLDHSLELEAGARAPIFVKVLQADGHLAWASPVYVDVEG